MKIVLFAHIHTDGKGDFQHLYDIAGAIKQKFASQNVQVYAVVNCSWWPVEEFESRLKTLDIDGYFIGKGDDPLWENQQLQKHLKNADQIFQISFQGFENRDKYSPYINPNALLKYIGEHECIDPLFYPKFTINGKKENLANTPMGLSPGTYGIKLKRQNSGPQQEPFTVIRNNDPDFFNSLLTHTHSPDLDEFKRKNFFVPAYFSKMLPFVRLVTLLAINTKFSANIDTAIFLSTRARLEQIKEDLEWQVSQEYFKSFDTSVSAIAIFDSKTAEPVIISLNENGGRVIRIFTGYFLTAPSFDAIFKASSLICGVSGDNTFELAITYKKLPFYFSTNHGMKEKSLAAISEIIKQQMALTGQVKSDLLLFFDPKILRSFVNLIRPDFEAKKAISAFQDLDLIAMAKVWPQIAEYIIENHNFYDRLIGIVNAGLTPSASISNGVGNYHYHTISQQWPSMEADSKSNSSNNFSKDKFLTKRP